MWAIIVMLVVGLFQLFQNPKNSVSSDKIPFSEFLKNDIVCIVEESQNKFLAVGKSEVDSSELESMDKGEVLKNLHYISDKAWEVSKTL